MTIKCKKFKRFRPNSAVYYGWLGVCGRTRNELKAMKKIGWSSVGVILVGLGLGVSADTRTAGRTEQTPASAPVRARPATPQLAAAHPSTTLTPDAQNKLVGYYCSTCHDDEAKTGGLTLASFDAAKIDAETAEKMIRKLRLGMMPPPAAKERPDAATLQAFAASLET